MWLSLILMLTLMRLGLALNYTSGEIVVCENIVFLLKYYENKEMSIKDSSIYEMCEFQGMLKDYCLFIKNNYLFYIGQSIQERVDLKQICPKIILQINERENFNNQYHIDAKSLPDCVAPQPRVLHGGEAAIHFSSPFFVHLGIGCSGVLIEPQLAMTARHCVEKTNSNYWSIYGNIDDNQKITSAESRKIRNYIYSPDLSPEQFDIAIVLLDKPFVLEKGKVETVQLPSTLSVEPLSQWYSCQMIGSGITNINGKCVRSEIKRYLTGKLMKPECCNTVLNFHDLPLHHFPFGTLCFLHPTNSPCSGDSGASYVCKSSISGSDEPVAVAVHKGGKTCCDPDFNIATDMLPKVITPINGRRLRWIEFVRCFFKITGALPFSVHSLPRTFTNEKIEPQLESDGYVKCAFVWTQTSFPRTL
jgi:hypothetical protein